MEKYRTVLLIFFIMSLFRPLSAQQLSVENFYLDEMDITANLSAVIDPNTGKKCALIKIQTSLKELQIDLGTISIVKIEQQNARHPMEVYVFVPEGAKNITISHPQMQPLEDYDFGYQLQSSKTYHLTLFSKLMNTSTEFQFVSFDVFPYSATLFVNGDKWELDPKGQVTRLLPHGTYQYKLTAPKYKEYEGQFNLGNVIHSEKVSLSLGFGTLFINSEPPGAMVQIDKNKVGTTPIVVNKLSYGEHQVLIVAKDYIPQWKSIEIQQEEPTSLNVTFGQEESSLYRSFEVYGISFNMVKVKGGTIKMENNGNLEIKLSDYYIGTTEVTRELWYAVMEERKINFEVVYPLAPINVISWEECQKFIKRLNKMTKQKFRLPTEAEWEFAAKGGGRSQGYLYSGSDSIQYVANYMNTTILPVHSFYPNELGIYDMSGNVWEYCADCQIEKSVKKCVVKGGGFHSTAESCRVNFRTTTDCSKRNENIGLRLVL